MKTKLKLAIIGTRGIPNNYGGFEQFAETLSKFLVARGIDVYVYNSSLHPYKKKSWNGVKLIHKFDPENKIGTAGQFIYDLNCILDCRKRKFNTILQLGYTSSSIWNWLLPKTSKIITNMDGLEWKRSKYNMFVRRFLKLAEKLAIKHSDFLVADSKGIQNHLMKEYGAKSKYIAYGVDPNNIYDQSILNELNLSKFSFNMLIARMEPENNIEVILDGVSMSKVDHDFLVVGSTANKFGAFLKNKFKDCNKIKFVGAIYNTPKLNSLRKYSNIYFHGHSVGGTNPSLLEAMASYALICAHDNIFNKSILGENGFYFTNSTVIANLLDTIKKSDYKNFLNNNFELVTNDFSLDFINSKYAQLIE